MRSSCQTLPGLPRAARPFVKPARLHFARAARALAGRYTRDVCERGVLSEYPAARARASYWFDTLTTRPSGRFAEGRTPQRIYFGLNMRQCASSRASALDLLTGDARLEFLRISAPEMAKCVSIERRETRVG